MTQTAERKIKGDKVVERGLLGIEDEGVTKRSNEAVEQRIAG